MYLPSIHTDQNAEQRVLCQSQLACVVRENNKAKLEELLLISPVCVVGTSKWSMSSNLHYQVMNEAAKVGHVGIIEHLMHEGIPVRNNQTECVRFSREDGLR